MSYESDEIYRRCATDKQGGRGLETVGSSKGQRSPNGKGLTVYQYVYDSISYFGKV